MEPFIGEIIMFGGNFAPRGWAFCDGQLLPISSNSALFSILGTTYGGDGRTTFALPDLRGRAPIHAGNGPGLSSRRLGEKSGTETVTLDQTQMPAHTHNAAVSGGDTSINIGGGKGNTADPNGNYLSNTGAAIYKTAAGTGSLGGVGKTAVTVTNANAGASLPHNNMQPYLVVNYIIALIGIYPSRS